MTDVTEAPECMSDDEYRCPYVFVWIGEPTEVYCGLTVQECFDLHYERTGDMPGVDEEYGLFSKDEKVIFHDGQVLAWETIAFYNIGHGIKMPEQIMTQYL